MENFGIKTKLSIGILSWGRENILEQTLKSYKKNGLFDLSDDITIFFNEITEKDIKIAKKYKINYIGNTKNIGIQKGILELLKKAKNEYFLFLENDWSLIENQNKTYKLLDCGIKLLKNNEINVLRLRSAKKPGEPLVVKQVYDGTLASIPRIALISAIHVIDDLDKKFPNECKKITINKIPFYVFDSKNSNYTNNPCLYKTSFYYNLLNNDYYNKNLDMSAYAKEKKTSVKNISLEADIIPFWENANYKCAISYGLFTHKDYFFRKNLFKIFSKEKKGDKRTIRFLGLKLFSYVKDKKNIQKVFSIDYVRSLGVKCGNNTEFIIHPHEWSYPDFGSEPFLIEIGDDCTISFGCTFLTHDGSRKTCLKYIDSKLHKDLLVWKKIKIGNNCFIGCNSTIMPGVTIGDNSVVGACSVVTKNIPEGEVWAGNPARFVRKTSELAEKILQYSFSKEAELIKNDYKEQFEKMKQIRY